MAQLQKKVWVVYVPSSGSLIWQAFTTPRAACKHALNEVYDRVRHHPTHDVLDPQKSYKFVKMCDCYLKNVQDVLTVPENELFKLLTELNRHYHDVIPHKGEDCYIIECNVAE